MNSRMFMLVSIIEVIAIVYVLCRIFRLMKKLFAVIRRRGEGSSIKTYGNPVAGVYTVLASKDFYDGIYQGIKILAEAQDGTRHVFVLLPLRVKRRGFIFLVYFFVYIYVILLIALLYF